MRILHVLGFIADNGCGIVNTAVDLAIEQARQGHAVAVASGGGGYEALLAQRGIRHFTLKHWNRPKILFQALFRLRRQILEFRPDVVHAHMRTGLVLAWVWSKPYGFSLVAHLHNVHDRESVIMRLAQRVIVVSNSVAQTMERQGIPRRKIRVVLNRTLDSPRQPAINTIEAIPLKGPAIVCVGGLSHRKGIAELLSAFETVGEMFSAAHLYLVGDGPQRAMFEEQARASRWSERIHFEGFAPVPQAYMLSADVFVLPSRRESFGLVLIEARQAGCAIVATDIDGIAEALDAGQAGLLVPVGDPDALAEALCSLIGDEAERNAYRQKALRGIEAYRVDAMAREVERIYLELVRDPQHAIASDTASTDVPAESIGARAAVPRSGGARL